MKKNRFTAFLLILAVLSCALLLGGCQLDRTLKDFDTDAIRKAQQIVVSDAASGTQLRTLESQEDLDAFAEAVASGGWELAELPEDAVREGAFLLRQQSTLHADGEEPQITELCTLYSYRDAPYLTIETYFLDITFSISDRAENYLHSLLS